MAKRTVKILAISYLSAQSECNPENDNLDVHVVAGSLLVRLTGEIRTAPLASVQHFHARVAGQSLAAGLRG